MNLLTDWYVHSRANTHMILDLNESMLKIIPFNTKNSDIFVANKESVPVLCAGDLQITKIA